MKAGAEERWSDRRSAPADANMAQRAINVLVVGDEHLALELLPALRELGLEASCARTAEGVHSVVQEAPDLVVLVGSARRGGAGRLLEPLTGHPSTAEVPVVLLGDTAEIPMLGAPNRGSSGGVVGRVQRELGPAQIAREVLRIVRELPQGPSEARGVVAEATLDQLVELLSRELQSGVLPSLEGEQGAQLVLRAGRPVSGGPAARGAARAEPPPRAGRASQDGIVPALHHVRLLVVHEDAPLAAAFSETLRRAGAQVRCLSQGKELAAARGFDPQVLLMAPAALEARGSWLLEAVQRDPRLRWAATLVLPLGGDGKAQLDLADLAGKVARLIAPHHELARSAARAEAFETRLEVLGPAQLLRVLCETRRALCVAVRQRYAQIDLLLSGGEILDARGLRCDRGTEPVEGSVALALFCMLRNGRVSVRRRDPFVRTGRVRTLSLEPEQMARPTPLPSAAPAPLVSSIPPPPRLPSGTRVRADVARRGDAALGLALAATALVLAGLAAVVVWM